LYYSLYATPVGKKKKKELGTKTGNKTSQNNILFCGQTPSYKSFGSVSPYDHQCNVYLIENPVKNK